VTDAAPDPVNELGPALFGTPLRFATDVGLLTMFESGALEDRRHVRVWRVEFPAGVFMGSVLEAPDVVVGPYGTEFEVVEWVASPLIGLTVAYRTRRAAVRWLMQAALDTGLLTFGEIRDVRADWRERNSSR
jgi:hypothetical protein